MARPRSRRVKLQALVLADALGSSEEAGKQLGMAGRSIRRWRDDPELSKLVLKTREQTADDVQVAMTLAWELIIQRLKAGEIDTRDLIVLGGVAFDKHQLVTGGVTGRTESRDLTGTLSDGDVIAAIREAESVTSAGRGEAESTDPPEG